jgi:hypothetical protein
MSYAEAKAQADREIWMEALRTAMVSSVAGGISGAATSTYGNATAAQEGTQSQQKPETKTEAQTEGKQETPAQTTEQPVAAQDGEAQAQTPTAQTGTQTAAAPQGQPVAAAPVQTPDIQNAVQGVVQGLNQRQQAEAEARAEQARTREAIEQGMAQEYGPMMPQAEPKSQMQQDVDNATAAGLAEQGIGEQAVQVEQEARATQSPVLELAENQGIKGTGAAEQNFSGTAAYDAMLSNDNVQPPRGRDARNVEVPIKDAEGKNVSRFVSNSMNAKVTPDSFTDTIKKMVIDGKGSYEIVSDEKSLEMAAEEIAKDGGIAESVKRVREAAESGRVGNSDIAKAQLLYQYLVNDKSQISEEMAADVWVSMKEMATISGRNLHLFSLLQKMTPEGRLLAVEKNINRYVESINKNRTGKKKVDLTKKGKTVQQQTADAVSKARDEARNTAKKASKNVRYKKGKVVVDWNQNGEPFTFEYSEKVGEALAKGLENRRKPRPKKTFLQDITSELKKFAAEKMPPAEKNKTLSATELLRDYIQNQDFYTKSWNAAREILREKYADDPYYQEFIGSGIGVDANANQQNKIFTKAIAVAAFESGETTDILRRQQALGITNMSDTIAQKLIDETGATGEMAQTIRDAAREYVAETTKKADQKENAKNYTPDHFVNEAMRDIKETMNNVAKQNEAGRDKVKNAVIDFLIKKYGFGNADASHVADVIGDTFDQKAQDQAKKILEQKFGERDQAQKKSAAEIAAEYTNLGAFDSEYSDKAAESFIRAAMDDIGTTISEIAKSGKLDKESARAKISEMIANQHGLAKEDADHIADVVEDRLTAMTEAQAKKILEQKFKPKTPRDQKTAQQIFEEYANLGAFDALSEYNEQATAKIVGDKYNATINSDLAENFLNAKNEAEQKEAMDAIYKDVAAQIKPTIGEMWDAWRHLAMLGNAKTHGRNFGSTAAFQPYVEIKRNMAATMEYFLVSKENRTTAVLGIGKNDRGLINWARNDVENIEDAFKVSGRAQNEARNKIEEHRKILPGVLDKISKKNMELMEKEDFVFKKSVYAKTLAAYLKAKGYTADQVAKGNVPQSVLDDGRQRAINEALKATFNDRNKFSDAAARLRVKGDSGWAKALNIVAKGIVPFARTPANVVVRVAEYSPAGIAKGVDTIIRKVKTGEATVSDGLNQIAAGCTGTLAWGIGAAMAAGLIPGVRLIGRIDEEDDYPEDAIENSIQVGDKYYAIGWLAPAAVPFLIGANLYNNWKRLEKTGGIDDAWDLVDVAMNVFSDVIDPILELSMLSSLKDVTDAYSAEETPGQGFLAVLTTGATNYFTQGLPTILGQIEQATETKKTSTYVNTENRTEARIKRIVSNATQKIPGVDLYRTQKLDRWGNPVEVEENAAIRAVNALVNPFTTAEASNDLVDKEIERLNKAQTANVTPPDIPKKISYTDTNGETHKDYRLTEEQYQKIAVTQGQTAYRIVENLVNSDEYKGLTDDQKAYAIRAAYEYAQEKGKQAAIPNYYSEASAWISETEETDTKAFIARGARLALDNAIGNAVNALKNSWNVTPAAKSSMEGAYEGYNNLSPEAQERVLEDADSSVVNYIDTRNAGGTTQNYLDAVGNVQKLGDGAKTVDKWGAVAATKGLKPDVADALMKAYMTDYDPDSESPNKTEPKYDYMRHKMGMTTQEYVEAMRVYYEVQDIPAADLKKDEKKKDLYLKRWQDTGLTEAEANELYYLLVGSNSKKHGIDVIDWYNNWSGAGNTETETNKGDSNVPWYLRFR